MRMAELARASGVSRETIHFYLREGLLHRPDKRGRTLAWYDETHLERLRLIRRLREEKYLPLDVIRRMIDAGAPHERDVEALADVLRIAPSLGREAPGPADEETTRVALELGLLGAQNRAARPGDPVQARVLAVVAEALSLEGDARELTLADLHACARELERLVDAEASLFFDLLIRAGAMPRAVEALRAGRGAVARYITAFRDLQLQRVVDDILGAIGEGRLGRPPFLPLGEEQAARLGVAAREAALLARARAGDAAAANDLVWMLFALGDPRELGRLPKKVLELLRPRARLLVDWAAAREGEPADLVASLERAGPIALGEVLVAEAALVRPLEAGPHAGGVLDRIVPALHRLAAATPERDADPLASASAFYHRGRLGLALPRVVGRHAQAAADLERALEVLVAAPGRIDPAARARLEGNARLALGRWRAAAGDPPGALEQIRRARAIDPRGPIGQAAAALAESAEILPARAALR
jgi:DNA-binding transcriptional MerR regulator